jgi:hypothetical protein
MIYKPPMNIAKRDRERKSVFLAGSIEMGKAEDWQKKLEGICDDFGYDVLIIHNSSNTSHGSWMHWKRQI